MRTIACIDEMWLVGEGVASRGQDRMENMGVKSKRGLVTVTQVRGDSTTLRAGFSALPWCFFRHLSTIALECFRMHASLLFHLAAS
jgi:hypothetical protein